MHLYKSAISNCRDAIIVAITNCATSVFAAIIIFAIMGFKVKLATTQKLKSFFLWPACRSSDSFRTLNFCLFKNLLKIHHLV